MLQDLRERKSVDRNARVVNYFEEDDGCRVEWIFEMSWKARPTRKSPASCR